MIEAAIPFIQVPEYTLIEDVPLIGELKLQVFGPLVIAGLYFGWIQCVKFAKARDIDEWFFRDYLFFMLVTAFVISHFVSVLFYFPEQVKENPWVLLMIWSGLSSVGGFFGAWVGMIYYLKKHKQPIMPYADTTIYGLVLGWCFGRLGCALVHDHPGKVVEPGTFLAVGPWPDGQWRYDLGLLEFFFACALCFVVYVVIDAKKKPTGWLTGFVAVAYAPYRFFLDFFRGSQDVRYFDLTTAQWFTIVFGLAGLWLMFFRKPQPSDTEHFRNSDREAREAAAKAAAKGDDDDEDADDVDDNESASEDEARHPS